MYDEQPSWFQAYNLAVAPPSTLTVMAITRRLALGVTFTLNSSRLCAAVFESLSAPNWWLCLVAMECVGEKGGEGTVDPTEPPFWTLKPKPETPLKPLEVYITEGPL